MENQTNIDEVIQQLEKNGHIEEQLSQCQKIKGTNIFEKHLTKSEIDPKTKNEVQNIEKVIILPMIQKEELHLTQKYVEPRTEQKTMTCKKVEYVPYIQYKNGNILPYEKKVKKIY